MRCRVRGRGFTLIEAMIVVVIVGVLALVAVVAYRRWVRTSYMAEAHDMVSNIRTAEESFRAENGGYLDISGTLDKNHTYPSKTPGAFKTGWGGPCDSSACPNPKHQWSTLAIEPKGPVAFGYAVVADNTGAAPGDPVSAALKEMSVAPNLAGLAGRPWYVVEALGDINGDGVYTRVLGDSADSQLYVDREGE
jgi:prepilin-type N-terminal cleavage/methylation domain-containing protein